jgi:hypothetical protein
LESFVEPYSTSPLIMVHLLIEEESQNLEDMSLDNNDDLKLDALPESSHEVDD